MFICSCKRLHEWHAQMRIILILVVIHVCAYRKRLHEHAIHMICDFFHKVCEIFNIWVGHSCKRLHEHDAHMIMKIIYICEIFTIFVNFFTFLHYHLHLWNFHNLCEFFHNWVCEIIHNLCEIFHIVTLSFTFVIDNHLWNPSQTLWFFSQLGLWFFSQSLWNYSQLGLWNSSQSLWIF